MGQDNESFKQMPAELHTCVCLCIVNSEKEGRKVEVLCTYGKAAMVANLTYNSFFSLFKLKW